MNKNNLLPPIAINKKAEFNYFLSERIEAGVVLQGWEIKSLRAKKVQITDCYVLLKQGEAFLLGMQVTPLPTVSTHFIPDPSRTRKLLLHRKELNRLIGLSERQGYTIVATKLYWRESFVKCQIAVGKGKQQHDKRETIKRREWDREQSRLTKRF